MSLSVVAGASCDICGTEENTPVFTRADAMQVVECTHCGLLYISPRPSSEVIQSWYGPRYFSAVEENANYGYADYFSEKAVERLLTEADHKLSVIAQHCELRGADVLEIGCATGETCYAASRAGARIAGCDLSNDAIRVAQSRYPAIKFRVSSAGSIPFPAQSFDVIFAFELIEHLPSPSSFIEEVCRLLRPGGMLVLTTPNSDCGRRLGWDRWVGLLSSFEHLYFFNSFSLDQILSQRGLCIAATYSQGTGRMRRLKAVRLIGILKRLHLLRAVKAAYRSAGGGKPVAWTRSDAFHTLMVVAKRT